MSTTYNPQITISAAPGVTQYLRMALYEATAPTTEVAASSQLAPPHLSSRQLQFTGLNPVIHLVKLFVTDGLSTSGTIIANFSIDPRFPGVELKAPLYLYAGTTPGFATGDNKFTDPDGELEGWEYSVDVRGFGQLDPNLEIDKTAPGYEVIIPSYELQAGELHIVRFEPKLISFAANSNIGGNLFNSVEVVTTNRSLTAADTGKMFLLQAASSVLAITLPEIDSVVAGKLFMFNSQGGSHKNAIIQVEGSDSEKIDYAYGENTRLILGQSEQLWLYKWIDPNNASNRRWKVAYATDGIIRVGETFMYNKYLAADLMNAVFADGSLLDRSVYPRLWDYVQTLDGSQLVSDTTWNTGFDNTGRFSTGDGSTTFRVPKLWGTGFVRGVDGTSRKAGSYEAEMIGPHSHPYIKKQGNGYTGNPTVERSGSGNVNPQDFTLSTNNNTGTENRPANFGTYLLIRI